MAVERRTRRPRANEVRKPKGAVDLTEMLGRVRRNFRQAAQTAQREYKKNDKAVRFSSYVAAAGAYELALLLKTNGNLWAQFAAESLWKDFGRQVKRRNCLPLALMYMYGSHQPLVAKRANRHARTLKKCWQEGASATAAFGVLQETGLTETPKPKALPQQHFVGLVKVSFYIDEADAELVKFPPH